MRARQQGCMLAVGVNLTEALGLVDSGSGVRGMRGEAMQSRKMIGNGASLCMDKGKTWDRRR